MSKALLADRRRDVTVAHRAASPVRTVPKELVHLHDPEAVLLTNWAPLGGDRYSVSARWPDSGVYGGSVPLLLAQTMRQSGLLIGHAEAEVPLSHQTLLGVMDFGVSEDFYCSGNKPDTLFILVTVKRAGPRSLRLEQSILSEGRPVAEARLSFSWIAPATYRRLRGPYADAPWGEAAPPAPLAPRTVGRVREEEVVLAPSGRPDRWQLRVDTSNLALYDHRVDHVPGLALVEAAHQALHATAGPDRHPVRLMCTFDRYVEFDAPCWIDAAVVAASDEGPSHVEITGTQHGRRAFSVAMDLRRPA
ncbi:ScbA/BarX family gamma-butyrolactone biosynthesis protein [Streptomyces termitum]|uniref:Adhesin n=1 Tax=Streptomyces termitum TaxID=67368 RepID=A0A918T8W3_9ACTN|nr:ScbA/BarX family gamma-butyrolactone biosynthesis protein [Streptomyces termitum]GHB07991.1 adhesin [Streptomyces termitum]